MMNRMAHGLDVIPERIVCAAMTNGERIILGARHSDEQMNNQLDWLAESGVFIDPEDWVDGFYTNWSRFVDRKQAMIIAREQNQIIRPDGTPNPDVLYSECLY